MAPDRLPATRPFRVVELAAARGRAHRARAAGDAGGAQDGDPDAAAAAVQQALAQLPSLGALYVSMLTHGATPSPSSPGWSAAGHGRPDAAAVLVHCTAGKDRTGVAIALLLDAVGAEREAVDRRLPVSEENLAGAWAERMFAMIAAMGVPPNGRAG